MIDDFIAPLFNTEWGRRTGWGVLFCAVLLILIALYFMITTVYSDFNLTHRPQKTVKVEVNADDSAKLITQLPDEHIFGSNSQGPLPVTSLQIRLIGIVKADPEKFSRVIVSEGGKHGKVYQVGDTLTSGVKVNSITDDGVVLENDGRLEKLPMQRAPLNFQGMPKPLLDNARSPEE